MALDVVSICNRTCDLLSVDVISSLEDDSKAANVMRRNYAHVVDRVIRMYPWNCAKRRARLPALSTKPAWGYEREFQLPEGPDPAYCLRVWRTEQEAHGEKVEYKIEGRKIVTDLPAPLNIEFFGRLTDPAQFDPLLAEAVAAGIGIYAGASLVEAATRMEAMRNYFNDIVKQAMRADAQEGTPEEITANFFLEARF